MIQENKDQMTNETEMPDVIYSKNTRADGGLYWLTGKFNLTKYHNDRVLQERDALIKELAGALEDINKHPLWIVWTHDPQFSGYQKRYNAMLSTSEKALSNPLLKEILKDGN